MRGNRLANCSKSAPGMTNTSRSLVARTVPTAGWPVNSDISPSVDPGRTRPTVCSSPWRSVTTTSAHPDWVM